MNLKKGEAQQMFVYLITIIIAGVILLLGYKFIAGFLKDSNEAQFLEFKKNIEADTKSGIAYQSIDTNKYKVPAAYTQICIVDLGVDKNTFNFAGQGICDNTAVGTDIYQPIICDYWTSNANETKNEAVVYLLPGPSEAIKLDRKIKFDDPNMHFICPQIVNGEVSLQFEGFGRAVLIRPYEG